MSTQKRGKARLVKPNGKNKKFLKQHPIEPVGEILLLAGDIVPFAVMDEHDDFFNYVSDNFKTVYWIPGNHEYYYFDAAKKCGSFQEKIRSNFLGIARKIFLIAKVREILAK